MNSPLTKHSTHPQSSRTNSIGLSPIRLVDCVSIIPLWPSYYGQATHGHPQKLQLRRYPRKLTDYILTTSLAVQRHLTP